MLQIDETTIGQLVLLNASFIKPNVPLVNKITGELEKVNSEKLYTGAEYYRYYLVTNEEPNDDDIVWAYEGTPNNDQYQITFLNQVKNRERKTIKKLYAVSNSIVGRIHKVSKDTILNGDKEYFRFTKIIGKYAGFPPTNRQKITTENARERWDFIFKHLLNIESNPQTKRKIGALFGGIQNIDLTEGNTVTIIKQYSLWLKNKE